jgi:hypothetical protein
MVVSASTYRAISFSGNLDLSPRLAPDYAEIVGS